MNKITEITLEREDRLKPYHVKLFIEQSNADIGLPLTFSVEQERLIVYNALHINDYYSFKITIKHIGKNTIVTGEFIGESKQFKKKLYNTTSKDYNTIGYLGSQVGFNDTSDLFFRSELYRIKSIGYSEDRLIEEEQYYDSLIKLFATTFCAQ